MAHQCVEILFQNWQSLTKEIIIKRNVYTCIWEKRGGVEAVQGLGFGVGCGGGVDVLYSEFDVFLLLSLFCCRRYLVSTGGDGTICFWKWDLATLTFK